LILGRNPHLRQLNHRLWSATVFRSLCRRLQEAFRDRDAKCLGGLEVGNQFELGRLDPHTFWRPARAGAVKVGRRSSLAARSSFPGGAIRFFRLLADWIADAIALAALAAALAVAKSPTQQHTAQALAYRNSTVIQAGKVLGVDPDPQVRLELRRDGSSSWEAAQ
jgi:hypothetical protein